MSFWNRLQGYASEFVKSIDDGFANKNQQEAPSEDKIIVDSNISDNDIIQLDNEQNNSETKTKEINSNNTEIESKNQNDSNLDKEIDNINNTEQNQTQKETIVSEKQEEESEEKIQQRINELKETIKNVEDKIESQNKLFEKLQSIKEKMGPNSESLILEFETRNSKIISQIEELNEIEEKTKKEIEELNSNLNSLLYSKTKSETEDQEKENLNNDQIHIQLQKDYSNVQKELLQAQDEYNKIIETSKNLINEDQQLTIDIDSIIDLINKNKNRIIQLKKERESTESNIIKIQNEIESEKLINIKLSTENAASEKEFSNMKEEQLKYNEKVDSIKKEISKNKEKIKQAENENERVNEKQRRDKIEAMKNLASSLINQIEKERSKILDEIHKISNNEKIDEEKEETEKREMQNMINEAEIESKRLEKRFSDSKSSISNFVEPIENQIETLKSVFTANETVEKTVASRLLAQLNEIEQKRESIEFSNKKLNEEIEKANQEKESLSTKNIDLKIKEINEKTEEVMKEIEKFRNLKFDLSGQINQLEADISMKKSKLIQITSNKRSLESKYLSELREIREKQGNSDLSSDQNFDSQSFKDSSQASSLFGIWKTLAKKCGEIDNEIESKQEAIRKHGDLEKIFNETLEIVSEHQENVDIAKRTIQREKDFFKKRVQELMDQ